MTITDVIQKDIPFLVPSDDITRALDVVATSGYAWLPVVSTDGKFVDFVSEETLTEAEESGVAYLADIQHNSSAEGVRADSSLLSVLSALKRQKQPMVAVVDGSKTYIGCITAQTAASQAAVLLGADTSGATIAIRCGLMDYSLTRIVNVVEECDAKILSITTNPDAVSGAMSIYVKIATTHQVYGIMSELERFGYQSYVLDETTPSGDEVSELRRNYDELMYYLNV